MNAPIRFTALPLDLPTDADVADAVELLGLKEHHRPEPMLNFANAALVRFPKVPCHEGSALTVDELRAWCVLQLEACTAAEALLEERMREEQQVLAEERDRDCMLTTAEELR